MNNGLIKILFIIILFNLSSFKTFSQDINNNSNSKLGVNYNGVFEQINKIDLDRCEAKVIRGFVDYFQFREMGSNIYGDSGLVKLKEIYNNGYTVILNIKFNFEEKNLPTTSDEINSELYFLDTLLNVIYNYCDHLVCGNEPFIESKKDQRDSRLSNFYIAVAEKVNDYKNLQNKKIPLYIGAFDNLWKPSWQTDAAKALLNFAKVSEWIAGIDLHIHHTYMEDIDSAFEFVNPLIRDDQEILVTEFSLKNQWKLHLKDIIPQILFDKYGRDKDMLVYEYLNFTIHNPVSREEWVDFLKFSDWFESRKNYLTEAYNKFTSYNKFTLATYGLYQNAPKVFTEHTDPWIINPLLVNVTVVKDSLTGEYQSNYSFYDEFKKIMRR